MSTAIMSVPSTSAAAADASQLDSVTSDLDAPAVPAVPTTTIVRRPAPARPKRRKSYPPPNAIIPGPLFPKGHPLFVPRVAKPKSRSLDSKTAEQITVPASQRPAAAPFKNDAPTKPKIVLGHRKATQQIESLARQLHLDDDHFADDEEHLQIGRTARVSGPPAFSLPTTLNGLKYYYEEHISPQLKRQPAIRAFTEHILTLVRHRLPFGPSMDDDIEEDELAFHTAQGSE